MNAISAQKMVCWQSCRKLFKIIKILRLSLKKNYMLNKDCWNYLIMKCLASSISATASSALFLTSWSEELRHRIRPSSPLCSRIWQIPEKCLAMFDRHSAAYSWTTSSSETLKYSIYMYVLIKIYILHIVSLYNYNDISGWYCLGLAWGSHIATVSEVTPTCTVHCWANT